MNNMNEQPTNLNDIFAIISEMTDKTIPYDEWIGQLPSDVSIDPMQNYPERKGIEELFADIFDQEGYGLDRQVGGRHYQELAIQPIEFAFANNLNSIATLILKYITTAGQRDAAGKTIREDIEKSLHCHEIWLDLLDKYEPDTEN